MLENAIKDYFNGKLLAKTPEYELFYKLEKSSKLLFSSNYRVEIISLVIFHTTILNFQEVITKLIKSIIIENNHKIKKIVCKWLVCSEKGGIYLYEAISKKESIDFPGLKSSLIVFNTEDGTISFGPGNIYNKTFTKMMKDLIEQHKSMPSNKWKYEFSKVLEIGIGLSKKIHPSLRKVL